MTRLFTGPTYYKRRPVTSAGPSYLLRDLFIDTDDTPITSHIIAPTNTPGNSWVNTIGLQKILGNKLVRSTGSLGAYFRCTVDAGISDGTFEKFYTNTGTGADPFAGMLLRSPDSNSGWVFGQKSGTVWSLWQVTTSTTFTERAASIAGTITQNIAYDLKAILSGNTITCYVNGTQVLTYGSASVNATVTKHGINGYHDSNYSQTFGDFRIAA